MIYSQKPRTEKFIEKRIKYIRPSEWKDICRYQTLSEAFIEKHKDKVDWRIVSRCQRLSQSFIAKHVHRVNWQQIFMAQKLTPLFIKLNAGDRPHSMLWTMVSMYQNLSEDFIARNANLVNWGTIVQYQSLSEAFLKKHENKWRSTMFSSDVFKYQKLSKDYRERQDIFRRDEIEDFCDDFLGVDSNKESWLYTSTEDKLKYIKKNTKYKVVDDEYIIAYKSIRNDGYSVFNFQYKYEVGGIYTSQCDCRTNHENSFGLSAWNKKQAKRYHGDGRLMKVRINIEDIGAIVHDNGKIRCFKLEVLNEVKPWYKRLFNKS